MPKKIYNKFIRQLRDKPYINPNNVRQINDITESGLWSSSINFNKLSEWKFCLVLFVLISGSLVT